MRSWSGAVARDMMSVHVGMLKIQNSLYYTLSIFRQNWLSYVCTAVYRIKLTASPAWVYDKYMNSFKAVSHSTFILYIEWLSPFLLLAKSNLNLQNLTFGLFAEKHTKMARTDCGCFGKNNCALGVCSRKGRLQTLRGAENLSITDLSHAKDASSPRSYGLPRSEELRKEGGGETSSISLRTSRRA